MNNYQWLWALVPFLALEVWWSRNRETIQCDGKHNWGRWRSEFLFPRCQHRQCNNCGMREERIA